MPSVFSSEDKYDTYSQNIYNLTTDISNYDFYENRNYELSRKITKIVINILQKNSDNERYLQNA